MSSFTSVPNILNICVQDVLSNGLDQTTLPAGLQDWLAGRILKVLPKNIVKQLLKILVRSIKDNEFERIHDKVKITIWEGPEKIRSQNPKMEIFESGQGSMNTVELESIMKYLPMEALPNEQQKPTMGTTCTFPETIHLYDPENTTETSIDSFSQQTTLVEQIVSEGLETDFESTSSQMVGTGSSITIEPDEHEHDETEQQPISEQIMTHQNQTNPENILVITSDDYVEVNNLLEISKTKKKEENSSFGENFQTLPNFNFTPPSQSNGYPKLIVPKVTKRSSMKKTAISTEILQNCSKLEEELEQEAITSETESDKQVCLHSENEAFLSGTWTEMTDNREIDQNQGQNQTKINQLLENNSNSLVSMSVDTKDSNSKETNKSATII